MEQKPQIYIKQQPYDDDDSDIELLEDSSTIVIASPQTTTQPMRRVPSNAFQYGYSNAGRANSRLIVEESDDPNMVRSYAKGRGNYWFCIGCSKGDDRNKKTKAGFNGDIFEVSLFHSCEPETKEHALYGQELIKRKHNIIDGNGGVPLRTSNTVSTSQQQPQPDSRKRSRTATKVCQNCPAETPCSNSTKKSCVRPEKQIQDDENVHQIIATLNEAPQEELPPQKEEMIIVAAVPETPVSITPVFSKYYDMLKNKKFVDVFITSSDGEQIQAHRNILSNFSTVFDKAFDESNELPVKIKVEEFAAETIIAAIEFCYGKIDSIEGIESKVFKFALKYDIEVLKDACATHFKTSVNAENVCELIQIAYENNFGELKEMCLKVLVANINEMKPTLSNLPPQILADALIICKNV